MNQVHTANQALAIFSPKTSLAVGKTKSGADYVLVTFQTYSKGQYVQTTKKWSTRGQSFYPIWRKKFLHGGTVTTALSQLARWCLAQPVLPLSTWKHWCSEQIYLGRERGSEIIKILEDGSYPQSVTCVLCQKSLSRFDWWSLDGVSGPCCYHYKECHPSRSA